MSLSKNSSDETPESTATTGEPSSTTSIHYDADLIKMVRENALELIARDLISVQPMPSDAITSLLKGGKSEQQLRAEGYRPVSSLRFMWVKD